MKRRTKLPGGAGRSLKITSVTGRGSSPKTRLHRVVGYREPVYRADIDKVSARAGIA